MAGMSIEYHFQFCHVAYLDVDLLFLAISNNLDSTVLLLIVQGAELTLLLPVIERTDEYDN